MSLRLSLGAIHVLIAKAIIIKKRELKWKSDKQKIILAKGGGGEMGGWLPCQIIPTDCVISVTILTSINECDKSHKIHENPN